MPDNQQLTLDIKRINTRITAIADKYGLNSPEYKSQIGKLSIGKYAPYVKTLETGKHKGVIQLRGAEIKRANQDTRKELLRYGNAVKTITGMRRTALEAIGVEEDELTPEGIEEITSNYWGNRGDFENYWEKFYKDNNYSFPEEYKEEPSFKEFFKTNKEGRNITPEVLKNAIDRIKEIREESNNFSEYEVSEEWQKAKNTPFD